MRIALITIVSGRHAHLRRQLDWVSALDPQPHVHVVVSMGDPEIADLVAGHGNGRGVVVSMEPARELPLAAARNAGVATASGLGADAVVLLDVDCLPERGLLGDYERALVEIGSETAVISGRVKYLPEGMGEHDYTPQRVVELCRDHDARVIPQGAALVEADPRMLWSLNIAATVETWNRVGGFDESYVGYGGEDTDFGQRLAAAGGSMWWSGLACAYHQHHPTVTPPVQHAASIARNANIFRGKWGFDPMEGWLQHMLGSGHLTREGGQWRAATDPR
ncbi:galactosyltransferase-related protein [Kocuria sp.]|uniref:glycosyltransferase family 2 protein n=1 Tax=Kocuria sp. TaxID=1871328 RepID=UPI00289D2EAE|nr:galactosyltransferase-related protein [Kocuria sp.]